MKKILITCMAAAAALFSATVNAQPWQQSGGNIYSDPPTDNVGIGLLNGSAVPDKLTINGNIGYEPSMADLRHISGRSANHGLVLFANDSWDNGGGIMMHGTGSTFNGSVSFVSGPVVNNATENAFEFLTGTGVGGGWGSYSVSILKNRDLRLHANQEFEESWTDLRHISGKSHNHGLVLYGNNSWDNGGGIMMHGTGSTFKGSVSFVSGPVVNNATENAFEFLTGTGVGGGWGGYSVSILKNGNLRLHANQEFAESWTDLRHISGKSHNHGLVMFANDHWRDGSGIMMHGQGSNFKGSISFVSSAAQGANESAFDFLTADGSGNWTPYSLSIMKDRRLRLYGNQEFAESWADLRHISGRSHNHGLVLFANDSWDNGGGIMMHAKNSTFNGSVSFVSAPPVANSSENAFEFVTGTGIAGGWGPNAMAIRKDGKVVIGNVDPNTPYNYKLYVENGILTSRVKVAVPGTGDWSDFVFADDYELMPLSKVEEFIKENKHLPEIPSATEVVKDGVDLGAMDAKLLQKIEELTLHMIEQNKKIDAQQKEIDMLKNNHN